MVENEEYRDYGSEEEGGNGGRPNTISVKDSPFL